MGILRNGNIARQYPEKCHVRRCSAKAACRTQHCAKLPSRWRDLVECDLDVAFTLAENVTGACELIDRDTELELLGNVLRTQHVEAGAIGGQATYGAVHGGLSAVERDVPGLENAAQVARRHFTDLPFDAAVTAALLCLVHGRVGAAEQFIDIARIAW